jgi:hypothetical protein
MEHNCAWQVGYARIVAVAISFPKHDVLMETDSEAGDDQDGDNRYPENEAKFHNPSLRVLRASGIPVR